MNDKLIGLLFSFNHLPRSDSRDSISFTPQKTDLDFKIGNLGKAWDVKILYSWKERR